MKYYLTTPLYYVNAAPHIGHTYTTMAAETIARFKRMQGYDAVMFTGTDEHGQKVERSAEAAGKSPQEFTDVISAEFRAQWEKLNIRVDRTIRTTDPKHHKVVQDLFQRCMDNGYVYKGSYTGQYCVSDELYANEAKPGGPVTALNPYARTPPFEQQHISPDLAQFADAAAHANVAESASLVQRDARQVLGKDSGLQRPDPVKLGFCDQRLQ